MKILYAILVALAHSILIAVLLVVLVLSALSLQSIAKSQEAQTTIMLLLSKDKIEQQLKPSPFHRDKKPDPKEVL